MGVPTRPKPSVRPLIDRTWLRRGKTTTHCGNVLSGFMSNPLDDFLDQLTNRKLSESVDQYRSRLVNNYRLHESSGGKDRMNAAAQAYLATYPRKD